MHRWEAGSGIAGSMLPQPIVGNDADRNGCRKSAGMSWSEKEEKCVHPWEAGSGILRPVAASRHEKARGSQHRSTRPSTRPCVPYHVLSRISRKLSRDRECCPNA